MLFNTHLCNHILLQSGGGTWGTALYTLEVWVLGVGMSTLGAQTAVRRGSGAPSTDGPGSSPRHLHRQSRTGD
jgi:hypothetical protein